MTTNGEALTGRDAATRRRPLPWTARVGSVLTALLAVILIGGAALKLASADPQSPFLITKTDSADPVQSGAPLTYTITIVNAASAKIDNVIMTDQVNHLGSTTDPPALPQLSLTSTKGSCTQSYFQTHYLVSCSAGTLKGGESWTVTITGKVTAPSGTTINNTASVTGTKSAQNFTSSATATTQVLNSPPSPLAELTVNKAGPSNVVIGTPLLYTLTVNNTGSANATDIRVVDTLPAGVALVSASGNSLFVCTSAGVLVVTVTCDGGRVNAGSNATITIVATAPGTTGPITNTAIVDPNQTIPEGDDTNNTSAAITTTVTSAPAQVALTITKTDSPDPVIPGGTLTYSIHVVNTGSGPNSRADDVVVVDGTQGLAAASITASMTITNGTVGTTGGCTVAAPQVTCKIRSLNAGGTMDVVITGQVIADAGTTILNTATVTGNIKNTGVGATASAITEVKPAVDLSITKVDSPDPVCARSWPLSPFGGPPYPPIPPLLQPPVCLGGLTYTLVVGNSGIMTATGVVVRDELANGLVFDSYQDTSGAGFVCALDPTDPKPNVVKCDGGALGPGATATIKLLVVAPPTTGAINNKAEVDPYNAIFEADETNNIVFEGTGVSTGIDLVIRKHDEPEDPPGAPNVTDGFDPIATSGTQTYTIFVDNVGTQDVTNIRVHDYLPANTTFLSAEGDHGFICSYVVKSPLASHYVECEQGALKGTAAEFYPPFGAPGDDFATIKIKIFATPVVMGPTGPMHNEVKVDPLHEIPEANELNNIEFEDTIVTVGGASLSAYNQLKITKTQKDPAPVTEPDFVPPADASYVVATNGILIYDIKVENDATDPVSAIVVQDTLPSGARFIEARDTDAGPDVSDAFTCVHDGSATGGVVTCTDGALSGTVNAIPGVPTSRNIRIKMFAPNTPGTYPNLAKVDPGNLIPEGNEFDNESQVTTLVATVGAGGQNAFNELDITKVQTSPAGDVATSSIVIYTITVTNSGTDPAFGVAVRDTLPAGFIYIEAKDGSVPPADPNAFLCNLAVGNVINCTGATIDGTSNIIPAPSSRTIVVKAFTATQPGFYLNQALVDPDNTIPEGDETDNAAAVQTKVVVGAGYIDLQVSKSDSPDPVEPGKLVAYTVTVTNAGTDPAFNVNVRDVLPAGTTFVSALDTTPAPASSSAAFVCSQSGGIVTCSGGTLDGSLNLVDFDAGADDTHPQTRLIVIKVLAPTDIKSLIVPPATLSQIYINVMNQAFIDPGNAIPESNETNNAAFELTKVESKIDLTLDKNGPGQSVQSSQDKFTIKVENTGEVSAFGVEIHDPLPVGLIILNVQADNSNFLCQVLQNPVNVVDCVGDLGPGQNVTVTIDVFMTLEEGPFDNEACVDMDDDIEETNETNNCDTATTSVVAAGPESEIAAPGTCTDGLDNDLDGATDGAETDCQEDENTNPGSCSDGFDNDGDGSIDGADSGCPGVPDLSINKSADSGSVTLGQNLTYTLNVHNVGTASAGDAGNPVTVTDVLPDAVTFVSHTPNNGFNCTESGGTVTCEAPGGVLAAGASAQIQIEVTVDPSEDGGGTGTCTDGIDNGGADGIDGDDPDCSLPITNTATVSTTLAGETNLANNSSDVTTNVGSSAIDLMLVSINDNPDAVPRGDSVTYTIVVTNGGTDDAGGVKIRDTLSSNTDISVASATASQGFACDQNISDLKIECTGSLLAGQSTIVTIVLQTGAGAPPALTHTVKVDPDGTIAESSEANNDDTEVTTISGSICSTCIDLVISQILGPTSASVGDTVSFVFTVGNIGDTSTDTTVNPDLLIDFDFVSGSFSGVSASLSGSGASDFSCPAEYCEGELDPGEGVIITVTLTITASGNVEIKAMADPTNAAMGAPGSLSADGFIVEFLESNNGPVNKVVTVP